MRDYLFSFRGRINRARYWLFVALAIPFLMLLVLVSWAYALSIPGAYENGGPTPWPSDPLGIAGAIVWCLAFLALFIAGLAITVKRLHDREKAWWWIFIFVIAPNLLSGYAQSQIATVGGANAGDVAFLSGFVALAIYVWSFVELGCLRGTAGPNRFGPDPLML
jgi:uncharacterized membrane protein YhaH (DUF805 family)